MDGERAAGRAEVSKKSGKRLKTGNVKYSNTARGEGNKDPKDKDEWDNRRKGVHSEARFVAKAERPRAG